MLIAFFKNSLERIGVAREHVQLSEVGEKANHVGRRQANKIGVKLRFLFRIQTTQRWHCCVNFLDLLSGK